MARMPTLLELMQMDRNRSQAGAMGDFFNAVQMPMAAQPAAPAPQPARAPASAPMPAQAPAPAPERRGLLGGFFGPEGRDARARLAIGLEGMTLNPNEALIGELQRGIEGRETERQQNKTLEWLASLGTPQAQRALQYAEATGDVIGATKMALEPAPQVEMPYRQITGAQLGLSGPDAEKLFNVSPEGQVTAIGGAGTTVNVAPPKQETAFETEAAKGQATMFNTMAQGGVDAGANLAQIDVIDQLLQTGVGGTADTWKVWAQDSLGVNIGAGGAAEALNAAINQLVPAQRPPGSGTMSDKDVELFKSSLPRLINSTEGNQIIVETMRGMALYKKAQGDIANAALIGEITRQQAMDMLRKLPDPLQRAKEYIRQTTGAQPAMGGQMTPEEAARILLESANGRN